jgi:hypothetical protein
MNTPNQLDQAFDVLRQEHRSIQLPGALENALLKRATLQQAPPRVRPFPLYVWSLALAAAAIAIAIVLLYPHPSLPAIATQPTTLPTAKPVQTPPTLQANAQPDLPRHHAKRRPATPNQSSPGSFVPLPTSTGLPEPAQAMLIRTRIDTSSLRSYGLTPPPPGAPQTILAEFLVGDDGLPRAIRLIR